MTTDIEQLFESTTPLQVGNLDVQSLIRRGRARRVARRAGGVLAAASLTVGGMYVAGAIDLSGSEVRTLDPAGGGSSATDVSPVMDELIEVSRGLPAGPPRDGRALVSQGISVSRSGADSLEIAEFKSMQTERDDGRRSEVTIATDIPLGTTAEELRELVEDRLGRGERPTDEPTDFPDARALIERAEHAAKRDTRTEALGLVEAALPTAYDPADRIDAFQVLRSLDEHLVYRGEMTTLHGPRGIGISWFDGKKDRWHTLVFDPETGRFLGVMVESLWPDDEHLAIVEFSTVLESDVVVDDGQRGG